MAKPVTQTNCHCPCGESGFSYHGTPVLRFFCHCSICQQVYGKPFADIVALRSKQIALPPENDIEFSKHRLPPAVNRGVCKSCNRPVAGFLPVVPGFGLAFIPAANLPAAELPEPSMHNFYHRRVADINDELPKVSGYWKSQWAVTASFLTALFPATFRRG